MIKRLDNYMLRELFVPFLIGTIAVVFMFQINAYMWYAKNFDLSNVPMIATLQVIYYRTPEFMNMTLPVGTSLAGSLAMSRIARESELTAMRTCGTPILRIIMPIAFAGVLVALGDFYMIEKIMPDASRRSNEIARKVGVEGSLPLVSRNVPLRLGRYSAFFGQVNRGDHDTLDVQDVLLVQRKEPGVWAMTTSDTAHYERGKWTFRNSFYREMKGDEVTVIKTIKDFVVHEEILVDTLLSPGVPEEKNLAELHEQIDLSTKLGRDTKWLQVKVYEKYAVPASCIVFALVSPIFAILFSRSGGFVGVLISIVMVLIYYNGYVIGTEILVKYAFMPAWLCAWITNILFATLGLFAIRRLE